MDAISYSYADKQAKRVKKIINDPDSTSGVVTIPSTIASGETITIPAGRTAVLPNVQIDGVLNVDGTVFIPSGSTLSTVVEKVASTDNAIVRFDGTTGDVQNSTVIINDSGSMGINNNAPLQKLHVGGSIIAGDTTYASVYQFIGAILNNNSTAPCLDIRRWNGTGTNHGVIKIAGDVSGAMIFSSDIKSTNTEATTEKMRIDAAGNLLLGWNGGTGVIQATDAIYSWNNVSNFTYITNQTVSGTAQIFGANVGGVTKAAILSNGTYQSATNVYGSTSDAKLKENIVDTSPKLDKLMQVQVRNFNYIGQEYSKQIGVIAQEIEQIFPSVVFETKDTKQVEVTKERIIPALEELKDDDGNITQEAVAESIETYTETETVETGEVTKNVKYSVIYMMMLKGMQEQQEIINDLKSRIEILEGAK